MLPTSAFTFNQQLIDSYLTADMVAIPEIAKSGSKQRLSIEGTIIEVITMSIF